MAALVAALMMLSLFGLGHGAIMNSGGVPYTISNPAASVESYSLDFEHNVKGAVEHFDVYGEVQTSYSQVYWTRNAPIALPKDLMQRFDGKVMAITGYEIDQVVSPHAPPAPPTGAPLSGFACYPDCGDGDASVPIYHAYNHHYFSWLTGKGAHVVDLDTPTRYPNPTFTAIRAAAAPNVSAPNVSAFPSSIVFKENPGGEYRKSYHGYPSGYAQLLASPTSWIVEPMQIDTHNRNYDLTDTPGFQRWHLPKRTSNASITNLVGGLSPLIECPCSDRVARLRESTSEVIVSTTTCDASRAIKTLAECTAALGGMATVLDAITTHDPHRPAGCLATPGAHPGSAHAVFNDAPTSKSTCDRAGGVVGSSSAATALQGRVNIEGLAGRAVTLTISHDGHATAHITMSGPADVWFGAGLHAMAMSDKPYAIIIDGKGKVSERRLGSHAPGSVLASSVTLVSSHVEGGVRTVKLTRAINGSTPQHLTLPTAPTELHVIAAVGATASFAYHKAHASSRIALLPSALAACVCAPVERTYLAYMNQSTSFYGYTCLDEPRGDMLRHGDGTGRPRANLACDAKTYHGGLQCCHHHYYLTDRAQEPLIRAKEVDRYFLKWRYYFQEYVPATKQGNGAMEGANVMSKPVATVGSASARAPAAMAPALSTGRAALATLGGATLGGAPLATGGAASHRHLHHWVFLIDAQVNDYEEDSAAYGHKSIGKITAHLPASHLCDAGCDDGGAVTLKKAPTLYVITPHCHAPSCLREELWDADRNVLLCSVSAVYGRDEYGPTSAVFNERDYVALPPCIFGHQAGLRTPFTLDPKSNLTAVKYFNNTYRHLGQMAQWTGLATYEGDPY